MKDLRFFGGLLRLENRMTVNYKMVLQYDGTRYNGWQKQGNTKNTIQGKLEEILSRYFLQELELNGSGRTDAGVHAACRKRLSGSRRC